jgi:galactose mutarotase-like enzyme
MYQIIQKADKYTSYELRETETNAWVKISPKRGGIVTGYGVEGEEYLYMDQATFDDPKANIRGGIPILFPISGQLKDKTYEWAGHKYVLENHGVARNNAWEVVSTEANADYAAITIKLQSTPETVVSYPFAFELIFTIKLSNQKLTIEQAYTNHSEQDMPMYPGFHPYFLVDHKDNTFETDAQEIIYLKDRIKLAFTGEIDMAQLPDSIALSSAKTKQIVFQPKANRRVKLSYGNQFEYVVLWSEDGKPFICVEPWMALTNELNVKQELTYVKPNEALKTNLTISVEKIN